MPPKNATQAQQKSRNIYLYVGIVIIAAAVLLIPFSTVTSVFEDPYEQLVKQIPKSQYLFSAKSKTSKTVTHLLEFAEENSEYLLPIAYDVANAAEVQQLISKNISASVNTVTLMSLIFQPLEAHKKLVVELLSPAKQHKSNVLELKASVHMLTKKEKVNLVLFMPVVITATKADCEENSQQSNASDDTAKYFAKCTRLVHTFSVVAFKDAAGFTFLQVIQGFLPSDKNNKKELYTLRDWFMRSKYEPYNQLLFVQEENARVPFFQKLEELVAASENQVTPERRRLFEELFFLKLGDDFKGSISLGVLWNDSMGLMNLKELMEYTEFMKGVVNAKKLK